MPEMTVTVRWPDGTEANLYSPSLVMHDHLAVGAQYAIEEFVTRTGAALDEASARVRAKYGFECTSAVAQKTEIEATSLRYRNAGTVTVLGMHPSLPEVTP
ncbi:MSMEG_0570 family nitrogen starvation response protein [Marisediminicola senii]|uniref:MSMEG_0570 family nitrogen starvation response protein n=1 Tax=Marisediminicola senii TaxID=2711233 RepID=UPI0019143861|nr:MSMEG_0570 family nitrogen starvation response protein [Marisediminicola senii]